MVTGRIVCASIHATAALSIVDEPLVRVIRTFSVWPSGVMVKRNATLPLIGALASDAF